MRILVACEVSGRVRDAFLARGHDAVSCDLLPSESPGPHHVGDVLSYLQRTTRRWDALIAFPPCTHLASSGARWFAAKRADGRQREAIEFVRQLVVYGNRIGRWAIENPVGILSTVFRPPDQIIQPWQFGHGEVKATCLWLYGFPPLVPTQIVAGRVPRIHRMAPSPERAYLRSLTYQGVADAMARQWG